MYFGKGRCIQPTWRFIMLCNWMICKWFVVWWYSAQFVSASYTWQLFGRLQRELVGVAYPWCDTVAVNAWRPACSHVCYFARKQPSVWSSRLCCDVGCECCFFPCVFSCDLLLKAQKKRTAVALYDHFTSYHSIPLVGCVIWCCLGLLNIYVDIVSSYYRCFLFMHNLHVYVSL